MNDEASSTNADESVAVESDEQLMIAFTNGSQDSLGELFSRYSLPLFGFFRRRLADPNHAEELTQETFLALIHAATRYEPRSLFRTYLYAVAFTILRAHRRKVAFRSTFFIAALGEREPVGKNTIDTDVVVRDAVNKLERLDREILLLREFEQLSYAEIAELLKLPINTVRSRLFRARIALRDLLAPRSSANSFTEFEERV